MFGRKKMSSNDKFVMQAGRDVGNLKGRGKAPKTAPKKMNPSAKPMKAGSIEHLTGPSRDKGPSVGQAQTFRTSVARRFDQHK
jgi:hypothetical protein